MNVLGKRVDVGFVAAAAAAAVSTAGATFCCWPDCGIVVTGGIVGFWGARGLPDVAGIIPDPLGCADVPSKLAFLCGAGPP